MNGNDMIEHIEKCDSCILIQDRLDNELLSEEEEKKLLEEQNDCFNNGVLIGDEIHNHSPKLTEIIHKRLNE